MTLQDTELALRRLAEAMARAGDAWRQIQAAVRAAAPRIQSSLQLTGFLLQQIEAARRNPDHPKAKPWLAFQERSPREIEKIIPYLVMLLEGDLTVPRPRGRQAGTKVKSSNMVEQLAERIALGERPTTAARKLLAKRGFRGDLKNRADALVKALRKRDR